MPKAYAYIRVSTEDQVESGLGMRAQFDQCKAWYEYDLKGKGFEWAGDWADRAVSGGKPLRSRPQGMQIDHMVEKGDVVIFSKLDRGFRDTMDLLQTVKAWEDRGVTCVFLDIKIDTSTDVGRLVLTVMGAVATFERARISARIREGLAQLKLKGLPRSGKVPYPWKVVKVGGHGNRKAKRKVVICPYTRRLGCRVVELRHQGLTMDQIYFLLLREGVRDRHNKEIGRSRLYDWFKGELKLRRKEGLPPEEGPGPDWAPEPDKPAGS